MPTIRRVCWAKALQLAAVVFVAVAAGAPACSFADVVTDNTPGLVIDQPPADSPPTFIGNAGGGLVITPTFTANFNTNFGANAVAAQNAWIAAANIFSSNFNDNIHVNITVDATSGTSPFGQSSTFLNSTTYSNLRSKVAADSKTADDATALSAGGSMVSTDPVSGIHTWWVTRAQAKAIGLITDDLSNDGTTTFGAGNPFSFSGTPGSGFYDFKGVAAHEIAEVMGRLGISGGTIGSSTNSHSLIDDFSYSGAATKALNGGANNNFSIDNGTTLLKLWNNNALNSLDTRDWAPSSQGGSGAPDSFNQFSSSGVVNPVTTVDLRLMDVIGYDRVFPAPEPSSFVLGGLGLLGLVGFARRRRPTPFT